MASKNVRFSDEVVPLIGDSETRRRTPRPAAEPASWAPGGPDYDPLLPYGPNVYLARKKKPDPWWVWYVETGVVLGVLCSLVLLYFYIETVHLHVTHAYAYMGSSHAQHSLGHHYLNGGLVSKDEQKAMYWFREASKRGHAQAGYNLVAAHTQGYDTDIEEHEIEPLLHHAHKNGVKKAKQALRDLYPHKY